jgi:hypothetical protein
MSALLSLLPLVIRFLGLLLDRGVQAKAIKKEEAQRYIRDLQAMAKKLGTAAELRDEVSGQVKELDSWEDGGGTGE